MQQVPLEAPAQAVPVSQPAGGPQIVSVQTHEEPHSDGGAAQVYQQKDAEGNTAQQVFEYSRCTGRKKAVLIGINYIGTMNQLSGCINDANNLKAFITKQFGYDHADIKMLTDEKGQDPANLPTKANIIAAMKWLVEGAQKDDSLFLQYSGHGTTMNDTSGEERDNQDEAICPLDFQDEGMIVDDESDHDLLVKPLPAGCRLTCIFDSCFSETVMDLPYVYTPQGNIKRANLFMKHSAKGVIDQAAAAVNSAANAIANAVEQATDKKKHDNQAAQQENMKINTSPADVILWAGSMDSQTSADTFEEGKATGAMSYAFIKSLTNEPKQSYIGLLRSIQKELKGRYTQVPQLSSCHPIDVSLDFIV